MSLRYQVFNNISSNKPVFTSPWYWLAFYYTVIFSNNWEYCRIDDSKTKKTLYEWATGKPSEKKVYRVSLKDGTNFTVHAVNITQARNIVIYGNQISFDEDLIKLSYKVHPENILNIEILDFKYY